MKNLICSKIFLNNDYFQNINHKEHHPNHIEPNTFIIKKPDEKCILKKWSKFCMCHQFLSFKNMQKTSLWFDMLLKNNHNQNSIVNTFSYFEQIKWKMKFCRHSISSSSTKRWYRNNRKELDALKFSHLISVLLKQMRTDLTEWIQNEIDVSIGDNTIELFLCISTIMAMKCIWYMLIYINTTKSRWLLCWHG